MTLAIMQPTFNPWLGYFDMIDKVDCFVFFDDVQLTKRSWQVRNKILTHSGELFLTIPIKKSEHRDETLINTAEINYSEDWDNKHLRTMAMSYKKSPFFNETYDLISSIYGLKHRYLAEFNSLLIKKICEAIGIKTKLVYSSKLEDILGTKDLRLVNICKALDADTYLSAQGSAEYIEAFTPGGEFLRNGIDLLYHNYNHPTYNQINSKVFVPYIGIVDLLFNEGFEKALEVIRLGRDGDYNFAFFREHKMHN